MSDKITPPGKQPDALRRKLTKSGLAVPAVLATLASKPVLGSYYACTISGKVSGNASAHDMSTSACRTLGNAPSGWNAPAIWPNCAYFFATCPTVSGAGAYQFPNSPHLMSGLPKFVDAFIKNSNPLLKPTVLEVLRGTISRPAVTISPKAGMHATMEMGREAVAALLNALSPTWSNYPLQPQDVIVMFNSVAMTGSYTTDFGDVWSHNDVLNYFKSLHY